MSSPTKNPAIIAALRRLEAKHGILRPTDVVNAARSKSSPLHAWFTWDDSDAAEQFRLYQARQLIRVVVQVVPNAPRENTRVFVSVSSDRTQKHGGYRSIESVMSNTELRAQLLADAKDEMIHFRAKYRDLTELAAVFDAIDEVTTEHIPHARAV